MYSGCKACLQMSIFNKLCPLHQITTAVAARNDGAAFLTAVYYDLPFDLVRALINERRARETQAVVNDMERAVQSLELTVAEVRARRERSLARTVSGEYAVANESVEVAA